MGATIQEPEYMEQAREILRQLGGGRFRVMTGAKNFGASPEGLSFRLPGGAGYCREGINAVRVKLTSLDLYDVQYMRVRGSKVVTVTESTGLYADMLQGDFERVTGLRTRL